jgi:hypothetical protein
MRNNYLPVILLLSLCISCSRPVQRQNEIDKIELMRVGAWSDPGAVITVDKLLTYNYYGELNNNNDKQELYTGQISTAFWDTLNKKLERIKYKTVRESDISHVVDVPVFELVVHWKNKKKRILRSWDLEMDSVVNTLAWINNTYKNIKLKRSTDTIKARLFRNKFPHVDVPQIKFPPLPKAE